MAAICDEAGLWQLQRMHQQYVIGQREGAVRVFCDYLGRVRFRQVPAHLLHAVARPDNPDEPVTIYEYRPRRVGNDVIWTRELWDVSDPMMPQWRIETEAGVDITMEVTGSAGLIGAAYRTATIAACPCCRLVFTMHREPGVCSMLSMDRSCFRVR